METRKKKPDIGKLSSEEFLKLVESATTEELLELSAPTLPASLPKPPSLPVAIWQWAISVPDGNRSFWNILAWWEVRRVLYNAIVGICGLPAFLYFVFGHTATWDASMWVMMTIWYGLSANLYYTAGWVCEYIAKKWFGEKAAHFGAICFALGTALSVTITVLLSLIAFVFWR